jgi:hypothetical protein
MNPNIHELSNILAALGVRDGEELVSRLNIGDYLGHHDGLQLLAAGEQLKLGELLQTAKRLTGTQLDESLAEQRSSGKPLGRILTEHKLLSAKECEVVLGFQHHQRGQARNATKLYLGNVLVAIGLVTRIQLAEALQWQAAHGGKLGAALVALGHVVLQQVNAGLRMQRKLVAAVLLAALALISPFSASDAQAADKMSVMQVSAVVRASAHLRTEHQAAQINITPEDIARGYVEIHDASRFTVITPKGANYFIEFHPRSDLFSSVTIDGLGSQVEFGTEGGSVTQPGAGLKGAASSLSYRFVLKTKVQPGNYDWPLMFVVYAR